MASHIPPKAMGLEEERSSAEKLLISLLIRDYRPWVPRISARRARPLTRLRTVVRARGRLKGYLRAAAARGPVGIRVGTRAVSRHTEHDRMWDDAAVADTLSLSVTHSTYC